MAQTQAEYRDLMHTLGEHDRISPFDQEILDTWIELDEASAPDITPLQCKKLDRMRLQYLCP